MKIIFLGDISLNGNYIDFKRNGLSPFDNLSKDLSKADFVVGNLECLLSGNSGENLLKRPRLYSSPEALGYLTDIKLNVACLANNHLYDHLDDGFYNTYNFLKQHNILITGFTTPVSPDPNPLILIKNNISVAIFNYVTEDTNVCKPNSTNISVNVFNIDEAVHLINEYRKKVDFIVFVMHWGGIVEGGLFPDRLQPKIARVLIDYGVDLIIGHHSHTIQPFEKYNGKYIFYSLGNFCFSDFVFDNIYHPMPKRRMRTMLLYVEFFKNNNSKSYLFNNSYYINKGSFFIHTLNYKYFHLVRNFLYVSIIKRLKIIWYIYYLHLKYLLPVYFFVKRSDLSFCVKVKRLFLSFMRRLTN